MPCTDGGVPYPPSPLELLLGKVPAMLCALVSAMTKTQLRDHLNSVDWAEAGVTKDEFLQWLSYHRVADAARKARERAEKKDKALLEKAKSKLTGPELAALKRAL